MEPEGTPWRHVLLQRLLVVVAPILAVAVVTAVVAFQGRQRALLACLLPSVPALLLGAFARNWGFRVRAAILLAPLVVAPFITYSAVGFLGNGSLVAATAVVITALLFGRRGAVVVIVVLLLAPLMSAVCMLSGYWPIEDVKAMSLASPLGWARSTFISLSIWSTLGITVTFVVDRIERSLANTRDALASLRAEQAKREEAERERQAAQEAALQAQKMEIVGRLASGTAHDFNNLLGVVGGWAELLLLEGPGMPDRTEARAAIEASLSQGRALSRQLMALARPEKRSVTRICLEKSASAAVMTLSRVLPPGVKLTFQGQEPAEVDADETELQQVLFNLILNARDAMPDGGQIGVSTGVLLSAAPLSVIGSELPPGRWAMLRVEDSGPGIDAAHRERIFELFFTTKPVGMGSGLGLATVLRIARGSGGGVALEPDASAELSQPRAGRIASAGEAAGRGATFIVYLPVAAAP